MIGGRSQHCWSWCQPCQDAPWSTRRQPRCLAPWLYRTSLGAVSLARSANCLMLPAHTRLCVMSHNGWWWVKWKIGPISIQKYDSNKAVATVYKYTATFVKGPVLTLCIVRLPQRSHQHATLTSSNVCSWSARCGGQSNHPINFLFPYKRSPDDRNDSHFRWWLYQPIDIWYISLASSNHCIRTKTLVI